MAPKNLVGNRHLNTVVLIILSSLFLQFGNTHAQNCRDKFLWPFSANSIWNTPIGSNAQYVPANIYDGANNLRGNPVEIHNDQEWPVLVSAQDPIVSWLDTGGNFPGQPPPCGTATGPEKAKIQIPANFHTDCPANNNGAGFLASDNVTLIQMQPLYRPTAGGPIYAWYHRGAPQPFPWEISIFSDGNLGAHGGSGLSAFGGTIRLGELLTSTGPIRHALKLELWAHAYYFWDNKNDNSCFTWPAIGCDDYFKNPTVGYNGTLEYLKPGALLAIPPKLSSQIESSLKTSVSKKILNALVDYGGYIVDDTGSQQGGGAICMEHGVNDEIYSNFGYSISIENPLTPNQGSELYYDIVLIFKFLHVVVNNGPNNIGGGGIPRQPPPPPFC